MLWAQRLVLAPLAFWCLAVVALPDNNTPLPSFTDFINKSYTGTRFSGKSVVVVGGTSGIGFAAAAMFVQECASSVLLIGRNTAKGQLSADVINAEASQAHCATHNGANVTSFAEANIRHRGELRAAFANRTIHVLVASFPNPPTPNPIYLVTGILAPKVNTAGIPGWTGALPGDHLIV